MRQIVVTCDNCGKDLSEAKGQDQYGLTLGLLTIPCHSSFRTAVCVPRPIDREAHFCGDKCLIEWMPTGVKINT